MKRLSYNFKYKVKQGDGDKKQTIIEGFANRSFKDGEKIIDRGREHIPPEEWKIKEWLDNPIILFNHDKNIPIGRGLDIKVTDDGLWIKAMISQSDAPDIKKARDLIEEKILNSFSVGIDPEDEYEEDGSITLKGVNLLETSVVALPMNQASQFQISTKMLKEKSIDDLRQIITREKGAVLASEVHRKVGEMQKENSDFSREDILTAIAQQANISLDELFEFLAGNIAEASQELIDSFSNHLNLPQDRLMDLNSVDIAINQKKIVRPEEPIIEEEAEEDVVPEETTNEENQEELEEETEEVVISPDPTGNETDNEIAATEGQGTEQDRQDDEERTRIRPQHNLSDEQPLMDEEEEDKQELMDEEKPLEEEEEEDKACKKPKKKALDPDLEIQTEDFNDCVSEYIRQGLEHGKTQDQAIAYALSKCRKDKSCPIDSDGWNKIFDGIDEYKREKNIGMGNGIPMTPGGGQGYVESSPGDTHLQEARQTNVLLGQLIGEIQALKQILGGAMLAAPQSLMLSGKRLNDIKTEDNKESLDIIEDYHRKLSERLKKLDV